MDVDSQTIDKAIQNLPPELREKICDEYVATKMREKRKWIGMRFIIILNRRPSAKND